MNDLNSMDLQAYVRMIVREALKESVILTTHVDPDDRRNAEPNPVPWKAAARIYRAASLLQVAERMPQGAGRKRLEQLGNQTFQDLLDDLCPPPPKFPRPHFLDVLLESESMASHVADAGMRQRLQSMVSTLAARGLAEDPLQMDGHLQEQMAAL